MYVFWIDGCKVLLNICKFNIFGVIILSGIFIMVLEFKVVFFCMLREWFEWVLDN